MPTPPLPEVREAADLLGQIGTDQIEDLTRGNPLWTGRLMRALVTAQQFVREVLPAAPPAGAGTGTGTASLPASPVADLMRAARALGFVPTQEVPEQTGVRAMTLATMVDRGDVTVVSLTPWAGAANVTGVEDVPTEVMLVRVVDVMAAALSAFPSLRVVEGDGPEAAL